MYRRSIHKKYNPHPLSNIGIIYCTSSLSSTGREFEKVADCEVIEVAHAVKDALEEKGLNAELVDLDPARIGDLRKYDWVFNLAEPIDCFSMSENQIAEEMEKLSIHFTGAGSNTLKDCLDKSITKAKLFNNGIPTPVYDEFQPGDRIITKFKFPMMVKPVHEDGSIGISNESVVENGAGLAVQVEKIHSLYHQAALVEEYIDGREINAAILGSGDEAIVLPLSEITYPDQPGPKILTFAGKWFSESKDFQASVAKCPCDLDPEVEARIKDIALKSFHILDCRDYARVDFRLKENIPYVLEVNPNPCINPHGAGFVRSANVAGLTYTELIYRILESSVRNG
jgi:D-alanine-D-alanine ligase